MRERASKGFSFSDIVLSLLVDGSRSFRGVVSISLAESQNKVPQNRDAFLFPHTRLYSTEHFIFEFPEEIYLKYTAIFWCENPYCFSSAVLDERTKSTSSFTALTLVTLRAMLRIA